MSPEEQAAICKAIAVSCMWGHGGLGSVILDELQTRLPATRPWHEVHAEVAKQARRESVGVVTKREQLDWYLKQGYWLTNYDDDGCELFNPRPMNGLAKYVSLELTNEIKQEKAARDKSWREFQKIIGESRV